jgi:hypothetical protein
MAMTYRKSKIQRFATSLQNQVNILQRSIDGLVKQYGAVDNPLAKELVKQRTIVDTILIDFRKEFDL